MLLLGLLVCLHLVNPIPLTPDSRIANSCRCNGEVNSKGEGECTSSYKGRLFCYTDPGVCLDAVKSTTSERWWSYQACEGKARTKCECNGVVNSEGGGECSSTYKGRPFCYIHPGVCEDAVKSTSSEQWWSYQACDNKVAVNCSCNGQVNSKREGECLTTYRGRPFCYVDPGVCSDEVESTTSEGWWSYQACNNNSLDTTTTTTTSRQVLSINFPGEPKPESRACKCNGGLNSRGEGECSSNYRGRPFCYVTQGLCQDEVASTSDGWWWSFRACQQEENLPKNALQLPVIIFSPEQAPENEVSAKTNPREPITAGFLPETYCPDQCGQHGCTSSQMCAPPTCIFEGKTYFAGDTFLTNINDGCSNECECKAIFVSTNPLKVGGAVDCKRRSCTGCVHLGKRYSVGAFNDRCRDCFCARSGRVTCASPGNPGITPRNNPDPCTERSQNPPVSSVDLGVNSRITFEKETGENLRAPSKAITVAKQSAHATEIPDVGPNHEQEERMRCPEKQPAFGSSCSLPESLECGFGEECCCGKCSPALVLFCLEGTWQGFNTDFCFRSGEESC